MNKSRGKNSRFPEHHWVASSMINAFHLTFFQLGVYIVTIVLCSVELMMDVEHPKHLCHKTKTCCHLSKLRHFVAASKKFRKYM